MLVMKCIWILGFLSLIGYFCVPRKYALKRLLKRGIGLYVIIMATFLVATRLSDGTFSPKDAMGALCTPLLVAWAWFDVNILDR